MAVALPTRWRFWGRSILSRPDALAGVALLTVVAIPFCLRQRSDWDDVYVVAAARLARGEPLFESAFVYPPINAWLALPFVGLPHFPSRLLWLAVNGAALLVLLSGAWKLAGGGRLAGDPSARRREYLICGLGLLCGLFYAQSALANQQTDLVVAALLIVGCRKLDRRRDGMGGVALGLAAGIKCTPLLWAGYLAWRCRWKAAVLVPAVALGINLLPDLTHPPAAAPPRVAVWGRQLLLPMAGGNHDFGTWAAAINFNHSLAGLANRWLTWEKSWDDGGMRLRQRVERISPPALKIVTLGGMLVLLAVAWICIGKSASPSGNPAPARPVPSAEVLAFCLVLILMPLLSPHSSKPHFCTFVLPGFCLARAALVWPNRWLLLCVVAAATCAALPHKALVGAYLYDQMMWYGLPTLGGLFLFAGCCLALTRSQGVSSHLAAANRPDSRNARVAA